LGLPASLGWRLAALPRNLVAGLPVAAERLGINLPTLESRM
jgi:hypothetical protein